MLRVTLCHLGCLANDLSPHGGSKVYESWAELMVRLASVYTRGIPGHGSSPGSAIQSRPGGPVCDPPGLTGASRAFLGPSQHSFLPTAICTPPSRNQATALHAGEQDSTAAPGHGLWPQRWSWALSCRKWGAVVAPPGGEEAGIVGGTSQCL